MIDSDCDRILARIFLVSKYYVIDLKYFKRKESQLVEIGTLFLLNYKDDYSFAARYLSASRAAIQPVPAAVIA